MVQSNIIDSAYLRYLQKPVPGETDMQEVKTAVENRGAKDQEIVQALNRVKAEYQKQLPNVAQQQALEQIQQLLVMFDLNRAQGKKVEELMSYGETVDFSNLSDRQKADVSVLKEEVLNFNTQLADAQFRLNNN